MAAFAAFAVAGLAGLILAARTSWFLLLIGALAIVAAWTYTGGPKPYGYSALGEISVFIFFGLMNCDGDPYVIEYNCRMGDPETEAVMPRIESDLLGLFLSIASGTSSKQTIAIHPWHTATVVTVSGGYPGSYKKGFNVNGLDQEHSALVFHAGTALAGTETVTAGGRVFAVTGKGNTSAEALSSAYSSVNKIAYEGKYFRKDIGKDLMPVA